MRAIQRHNTAKRATRTTPWSKRPTWPTGAPRVCLTNLRTSLVVLAGQETFAVAGTFDYLLRLYQHRGLSRKSVHQGEYICYRMEEEWKTLLEKDCEWIELVDDIKEEVYRIDFQSALRSGSEQPSPYGPVWAVPFCLYV